MIEGAAGRGVARAAAAGLTKKELVDEAVTFLLAHTDADRIGVWIEAQDAVAGEARGRGGFRGLVTDRNREETLAEWERLSPEPPLPAELLTAGKTVEQQLDGSADRPILGALVEMRRATWVPVVSAGRLRGVLLAGARRKGATLRREPLEAVAAELALALDLEEQRRLAYERQSDLYAVQRLLAAVNRAALTGSGPNAAGRDGARSTDTALASVVDSCTETCGENGGLGAVFAVLRLCDEATGDAGDDRGAAGGNPAAASQPPRSFAGDKHAARVWWSGEAAWASAIESEPLAGLWRRAQEAHCPVTGEPATSWPRGEVARVVAIPLKACGLTLGVLVLGFRDGDACSGNLRRLEARAAVAATALLVRKQDREAAEHAAQLQELLQASSGATILLDAGGRIAGFSRGAHALLGTAAGEATLETTRGTASGSEPEAAPRFAELFRVREQRRVEAWLKHARGARPGKGWKEEMQEVETPQVELNDGGRVRLRSAPLSGGGLGVSLDPVAAPDTARAERAEAQLVNVIEWLEEGVVVFDADHGIRAMNARFAQIAGLAPEDTARIVTLSALIARLASQAAQPETFAERWREQVRGGGSGVREEIQLLRPVPRVLERTARAITDAAGRRLGRVEIYRDLTAQRVFQSKLLQTEKLAALGQMVTGVAHELSNPLTSILGYAQRLFLRGDAGRPDEVRQIFQEAERASTILRQLLMTARDSRPERRRVSLNEVVARTVELQRYSLEAEKLKVELDLDPALPFVTGDAAQLQQVLMNLIGNSRQAIEPRGKGGIIRLSTKHIGESRALLEVSDDGPGIPEAIASRIFDPFFTTKPAGIGTGLGLAIVLGIVREHGGQVRMSSPPGGGAVFSLEFPAARVTGPGQVREFLPATREPAAALSEWTGARVLVVEDEPTVARLIGDVLEDEGLQVEVLLDGREALERAARRSYDLMICDMKMPGLDGQHLYKTLLSTGNPLRKKFLFVTGDVMAAQTHEFLEHHRLPHVAKPFRVEELTEKVRRVLAESGPLEESPAMAATSSVARK